jgi:hypothetical protein
MKDTVHPPVHPSVHQRPRASVQTRRPCTSNGTQFGRVQNTELGWNDPGLDALPRPKGLRGRSSPVFCPWLSLRMYRHTAGGRVPRVKTVKNAFCTLGAATSSPSVQISTTLSTNSRDRTCETPRAQNPEIGRERPRFFGFRPPKKFSGSLPPDVGLWCARFLANARQPRSLPTECQVWVKWASPSNFTPCNFTDHFTPDRAQASRNQSDKQFRRREWNEAATVHEAGATPRLDAPCVSVQPGSLPPQSRGVTASVRSRERALSNRPYAAPHTTCPTRLHDEGRRVLASLKGTI